MSIVLAILAIFLSLAVHETSHGLAAYSLGDPTAKMHGRLTLNPLKHIDMVGTVVVPLLLVLAGMPVFGWAKPVPVNYSNFKNPVRDGGLTALAGPASNFFLALFSAFLIKYTYVFLPNLLLEFLWLSFYINVALGLFNFLPISPLDGSKIVGLVVPRRFHAKFLKFLDNSTTYFILLLLFDIYVMPSIIGYSLFGELVGSLLLKIKFIIFSGT